MERMKYITIFYALARIIFTVLIFLLIKSEEDYWFHPFLNSLSFLVVGVYGFLFAYKKFELKYKIPNFSEIKYWFKKSFFMNMQNFLAVIKGNSNVFFLGIFTNNIVVGYYASAEKIIKALIQFAVPLFSSFYPYISRLFSENKDIAINKVKKLFKYFFIGLVVFFIFIFAFSSKIVLISSFVISSSNLNFLSI